MCAGAHLLVFSYMHYLYVDAYNMCLKPVHFAIAMSKCVCVYAFMYMWVDVCVCTYTYVHICVCNSRLFSR